MGDVPKAILPATAALVLTCSLAALSDPLPPDATYRPLPTLPFTAVKAADEAQKASSDAAASRSAEPAL